MTEIRTLIPKLTTLCQPRARHTCLLLWRRIAQMTFARQEPQRMILSTAA